MSHYEGLFSEHPVRVRALEAAYVRAVDRQNIAHGAPFVLKRYVTGVGGALTSFSYSCTFVIHSPFILHASPACVYAILFLLHVIGEL